MGTHVHLMDLHGNMVCIDMTYIQCNYRICNISRLIYELWSCTILYSYEVGYRHDVNSSNPLHGLAPWKCHVQPLTAWLHPWEGCLDFHQVSTVMIWNTSSVYGS